jgi:hypothetical protein
MVEELVGDLAVMRLAGGYHEQMERLCAWTTACTLVVTPPRNERHIDLDRHFCLFSLLVDTDRTCC